MNAAGAYTPQHPAGTAGSNEGEDAMTALPEIDFDAYEARARRLRDAAIRDMARRLGRGLARLLSRHRSRRRPFGRAHAA